MIRYSGFKRWSRDAAFHSVYLRHPDHPKPEFREALEKKPDDYNFEIDTKKIVEQTVKKLIKEDPSLQHRIVVKHTVK